MDNTISLSVNTRKLVSELPRFFQNKDAFITELVQNAYRAGATRIGISVAPEYFTITDNGCGITNPKVLLDIAGSNWQDEVIKGQDPAGLGLFSAFMVGKRTIISSNNGERSFEIEIDKDSLLNGSPVEVCWDKPVVFQGTTLRIEGSFDVERVVGAIKENVCYYTTSLSGDPMSIAVNREELPQEDFLEERKGAWLKELMAGTVAIDRDSFDYFPSQDNDRVLFHGQTMPCAVRKAGERFVVPRYRLLVRGMGLTPRLPDRTAFVEDEKLENFRREFRDVVREGMMTGNIRITPELAGEYLTDADHERILPYVAEMSIDTDVLKLPSHPYDCVSIRRYLDVADGGEWEGTDIIIGHEFCDSGSVDVLAALNYLNGSGVVKVGVIRSGCDVSTHKDFVARYHGQDDLTISVEADEKDSISFAGNRIIRAKVTLRSQKLGKKWNVEGVIPEADSNIYGSVTYFWSLPGAFDNYNHVNGHLWEVTQLVAHISDDDLRNDPYEDDYADCIGEPLRGALTPRDKIIDGVSEVIRDVISTKFGAYVYKPNFSITVEDGNLVGLEVIHDNIRYAMNDGVWVKEAA